MLFTPGPTEVDPDILAELSKPVMAHYGLDWGQIYEEACEAAKKIFKTKSVVTIVPLPGTSAMEMSVPNILEREGDKVINITNGFFGDAQGKMLKYYGANVLEVKSEHGSRVDLEKVKEYLDLNSDVKAIYVVQNDTSTGILNDMKEIGKMAKKYDKLLVVDAISSFGGIELDFDRWGIDYAVGYASKCLSSINGVCPVAISERFVEFATRRKDSIRSYFYNIPFYLKESEDWAPIGHPHPTSVPTTVIKALCLAERKALEEGLEERYRRHILIGKAYRAAIRALSLETLPREEDASPVLTAVKVPEGSVHKISSLLLERFGLMIGEGLAGLEETLIRIGHMGITASPQYLIQMIPALELVLKELKMVDRVGEGVEAAARMLWT
ncbi:MAG: pyridoxal-phosphate-dependent aminotransferase family protein [Nitrososphaeria archaeon]